MATSSQTLTEQSEPNSPATATCKCCIRPRNARSKPVKTGRNWFNIWCFNPMNSPHAEENNPEVRVFVEEISPGTRLLVERMGPLSREEEAAAVRIGACFRGHLARRAYRALKSLVKLQAMFRGVYVRRQAEIAIRCMQVLVRLQIRVRSRQLPPSSRESQ